MKKILHTLLLLTIINSVSSQNNSLKKSILFVPIKSDMVMISKKANRVLKYNNIKQSIFINDLKTDIQNQIKSEFTLYTIDNMCVNYPSVCDSLYKCKIYNNFNLTDTSQTKSKLKNQNSYSNNYYGRTIDPYNKALLKAIIERSKIDYVIMINCLEISERSIWNNKTYFELHCEIYDKNLLH